MTAITWKNEFRAIGGTHEPVGTAGETIFWPNRELKCPQCGKWTAKFGEVSITNDDGTESYICDSCGNQEHRLFTEEHAIYGTYGVITIG
jgi:hypothetical protein